MKDEDQVLLTSRIFEYLGIITFSASMIIAAIAKPFFILLFSEEYLAGYIVMPYLFISPLLLMLYQVVVNQLLVIKKTWPSLIILAFGASSNILINFLLIKQIGIEGAAIGTFIGYVLAIIGIILTLIKMKLVSISYKFGVCVLLFSMYSIMWRFFLREHIILGLLFSLVIIGTYLFLYKSELQKIIKK